MRRSHVVVAIVGLLVVMLMYKQLVPPGLDINNGSDKGEVEEAPRVSHFSERVRPLGVNSRLVDKVLREDGNVMATRAHPTVGTIASCRHAGDKVDDYHAYFAALLHQQLGPLLFAAIYDKHMLGHLALAAAAGTLGDEDKFVWHIKNLRAPPVEPVPFSKPPQMLRFAKRLLSVGLGRMQRDVEMANLYSHTCQDPASAAAFRRALLRVVEAYVNYFYTILQLSLDAMDAPTRKVLHELNEARHGNGDVLTTLMTLVDHASTAADVEQLLSQGAEKILAVVRKTQAAFHQGVGGADRTRGATLAALFPLDYAAEPYHQQRPVNGKFWNMIRPTAACSSLVRLCEKPDGCRLLCNAEYLLSAGLTSTGDVAASSAPPRRYYHRLAGFGSNNEYDWELSLVNMFDGAARRDTVEGENGATRSHHIGWFTVFDCTLGSGARAWAPPKDLVEKDIGFGYASKCLDGTTSPTSYSLADLKSVLLNSESQSAPAADTKPQGSAIVRRRVNRDVAARDVNDHRHHLTPDGVFPRVRLFDAITILKIDVEGYEFNTLPAWGRDELANLGRTSAALLATGNSEPIDFETAIDRYFSVSLLSMEFHRSGHKFPHGTNLRGAQRSHFTLLHLYSLGFVMVGQEKNHQDNCCYELVWVHFRHFVRSEVWMAVGDGL